LATTEHTVREVLTYIPELAQKPRLKDAGVTEADLYFALVTAPLTIYHRDFYREKLEEARRRIEERDPEDVDLLALALKLAAPVWSNDQDYREAGVEWWTTVRLLKRLKL
jgi:predicted nucleic acid-binding protein